MGEMKTLGRYGDLDVRWDADNEEEVNAVREAFTKKIKEGWSAFREKFGSKKGDRIEEFDPQAERIILVPPIAGG